MGGRAGDASQSWVACLVPVGTRPTSPNARISSSVGTSGRALISRWPARRSCCAAMSGGSAAGGRPARGASAGSACPTLWPPRNKDAGATASARPPTRAASPAAGARRAQGRGLGRHTRPASILNLLRAAARPDVARLQRLGIDEWAGPGGKDDAWGRSAWTARQRVVARLPARRAAPAAAGVAPHPESDVLTRARAGLDADAATRARAAGRPGAGPFPPAAQRRGGPRRLLTPQMA